MLFLRRNEMGKEKGKKEEREKEEGLEGIGEGGTGELRKHH